VSKFDLTREEYDMIMRQRQKTARKSGWGTWLLGILCAGVLVLGIAVGALQVRAWLIAMPFDSMPQVQAQPTVFVRQQAPAQPAYSAPAQPRSQPPVVQPAPIPGVFNNEQDADRAYQATAAAVDQQQPAAVVDAPIPVQAPIPVEPPANAVAEERPGLTLDCPVGVPAGATGPTVDGKTRYFTDTDGATRLYVNNDGCVYRLVNGERTMDVGENHGQQFILDFEAGKQPAG
jgi:hypothetical protein